MDKAFIYNVYNFVSFHLCKKLLEQGVEVTGHYMDDPVEQFLEEKQLEVGRNANFEEKHGLDFEVKNKETNTVIISLYDLYMLHKTSLLEKDLFKTAAAQHLEDLILILPVQLAANHVDHKDIKRLNAYLDMICKNANNVYMFYLPTVYGPWQPSTFLFQQTILNRINGADASNEIRESTNDCLYIDDAVQTIISITKAKRPGKFLLASGLKNYWQQCAEYIQVKQIPDIVEERFVLNDHIEKISVKHLSSIAESFGLQIKHVERLFPIEGGLKDRHS